MPQTITLEYEDEGELQRKLETILQKRGFIVVPWDGEKISVGELARRVGRRVNSVSRDLRSAKCPKFYGQRGSGEQRNRLLWLVPNDALIEFLKPKKASRVENFAETETP